MVSLLVLHGWTCACGDAHPLAIMSRRATHALVCHVGVHGQQSIHTMLPRCQSALHALFVQACPIFSCDAFIMKIRSVNAVA